MKGTDRHLDEWARWLHEAYRAKDDAACALEPGRPRSSANVPWESLPETFRRANRESARHFGAKLRAAGRRLVPVGTAPEAVFTPVELEQLAEMEHERWMADRLRDGWVCGSLRDNARKVHPDLVPYGQLSEPVKQLDRDMVLEMVAAFRARGWVMAIVRDAR